MAAAAESEDQSITPLNVGVRGGQTVFDAELPSGQYSDIRLDVTGQNFIATVTVSGSQVESDRGATRIGSYTIFDLTGQKLGRSTVLHLPQSDFPYLHFSIKGPLSPDSISGLSVVRLPLSRPRFVTIAESSQLTTKGHSSSIAFIVPTRVPVAQIVFKPATQPAQFSRDVSITVESVPDKSVNGATQTARTVTSVGSLLRVHSVQNGQRIDEERLATDAPWVDFNTPTKWTITIDNGDDAPLLLNAVQLQMQEHSLCFDAAANTQYTLYYGDSALNAPRYDYATLFVQQASAARITAGPEQANAQYQPRPDARPFTEKHPVLLWIALGAVIVVLGAIALGTAKSNTQSAKQ
jgi:hypothetical protein